MEGPERLPEKRENPLKYCERAAEQTRVVTSLKDMESFLSTISEQCPGFAGSIVIGDEVHWMGTFLSSNIAFSV
jgi:hypothetical protein